MLNYAKKIKQSLFILFLPMYPIKGVFKVNRPSRSGVVEIEMAELVKVSDGEEVILRVSSWGLLNSKERSTNIMRLLKQLGHDVKGKDLFCGGKPICFANLDQLKQQGVILKEVKRVAVYLGDKRIMKIEDWKFALPNIEEIIQQELGKSGELSAGRYVLDPNARDVEELVVKGVTIFYKEIFKEIGEAGCKKRALKSIEPCYKQMEEAIKIMSAEADSSCLSTVNPFLKDVLREIISKLIPDLNELTLHKTPKLFRIKPASGGDYHIPVPKIEFCIDGKVVWLTLCYANKEFRVVSKDGSFETCKPLCIINPDGEYFTITSLFDPKSTDTCSAQAS